MRCEQSLPVSDRDVLTAGPRELKCGKVHHGIRHVLRIPSSHEIEFALSVRRGAGPQIDQCPSDEFVTILIASRRLQFDEHAFDRRITTLRTAQWLAPAGHCEQTEEAHRKRGLGDIAHEQPEGIAEHVGVGEHEQRQVAVRKPNEQRTRMLRIVLPEAPQHALSLNSLREPAETYGERSPIQRARGRGQSSQRRRLQQRAAVERSEKGPHVVGGGHQATVRPQCRRRIRLHACRFKDALPNHILQPCAGDCFDDGTE